MRKPKRNITYIPETGDLDADYCTGRELMDATKAVVSTLSRNGNSTVRFAGDGAFTDGENVVLPSIPDDATITKRQGLVTGGYANHETLHNLLTEFHGETREMCERWHRDGRKLTASLANAMEDVRIEMGGRDLYNGLPKSIDKTAHEVNTEFLERHLPNMDAEELGDFTNVGAVAITWEGRKRLGYPSDTMQRCLDAVSDDVRRKASIIVDAIQHLATGVEGMGSVNQDVAYQGCRELHKLAEKIADDEMRGKNGQQREEIEYTDEGGNTRSIKLTPDATGSAGGERGSGDGSNAGDAQREGDQGTAGSPSDADATGSSGDGGNEHSEGQRDQATEKAVSGTGFGASISEDNIKIVDPELGQAMDQVFQQINRNGNGKYRVMTRDADRWVKSKKSKFKNDDGLRLMSSTRLSDGEKYYAQRKKDMGNKLGTMRRKLERALMSEARTAYATRKADGKLDMHKLTNVIQFDANVFRKRVDAPAIDTAVAICTDLSGSMAGYELTLATDCAIAIAEALEGTGVAVEITGHNTAGGGVVMQDSGTTKYNRKCAIKMVMFKAFNESLRRCMGAIGCMVDMSGGANSDGDAWLYAADRLLRQPQKRKVFIALSDGAPRYSSDFHDQDQHTRDAVGWMEMQGIDVVGIGIATDAPRRFFPKHVICNDLEELSKNVMDQLGKMLIGSRFVVDNADLIKSSRADAKQAR